jgi:hypothetical protein
MISPKSIVKILIKYKSWKDPLILIIFKMLSSKQQPIGINTPKWEYPPSTTGIYKTKFLNCSHSIPNGKYMIDGYLFLQEENSASRLKVYSSKGDVWEFLKWKRIIVCWKGIFYWQTLYFYEQKEVPSCLSVSTKWLVSSKEFLIDSSYLNKNKIYPDI